MYFFNGVAYDFYSLNEIDSRSGIDLKWKTFPLPNEYFQTNIVPWLPNDHHQQKEKVSVEIETQKGTTTGLAFVDKIYITSAPNLIDRHMNLKRMMTRYQITNYELRMKWARDTCYSQENRQELLKKMNLRSKPMVSKNKQRQCAITMEHIEIWHDIVARNSTLSLILEDDAVFVPYFPEKIDRTIYTAVRTGALKIGGLTRCTKNNIHLSTNSNEWFQQDPIIFIGGCMELHDNSFAINRRNSPPMLSTHKESSSRCSHAYLLTACSAHALIKQVAARKNTFMQSDLLLNALVAASPTLQSFWLDPPIAYQGNRINDLDEIPSFKRTTY